MGTLTKHRPGWDGFPVQPKGDLGQDHGHYAGKVGLDDKVPDLPLQVKMSRHDGVFTCKRANSRSQSPESCVPWAPGCAPAPGLSAPPTRQVCMGMVWARERMENRMDLFLNGHFIRLLTSSLGRACAGGWFSQGKSDFCAFLIPRHSLCPLHTPPCCGCCRQNSGCSLSRWNWGYHRALRRVGGFHPVSQPGRLQGARGGHPQRLHARPGVAALGGQACQGRGHFSAMPQGLLWVCLAVWEASGDLPFIAQNDAALMVNW